MSGDGSETVGSSRFDEFIDRFEDAWRAGEQPDLAAYIADAAENLGLLEALVLCDLEWHWRVKAVAPPRLEDYLRRYPQLAQIEPLPISAVEEEYRARHNWGDRPGHEEYRKRFAERWEILSEALDRVDRELARELRGQEPDVGERLGRYRIREKIGHGGFGIVYRAHDEELSRDVAIKVPYRERVARREDAYQFLSEARTIAGLDHPHIVPVFDTGRTDDGICYVVTKLIEGSELTHKVASGRCSFRETVAIIADVADGLHHAHLRGVTHRDVKPANILLDAQGEAYVTDFGLAVHESDTPVDLGVAGTPAYMSPEQARGEGHRVDGRTDIFSLGVVFYELLTGRRPFRADSTAEILEMVKYVEARPPRQFDDTIPRELERICLKAMSKRIADRYSTAADFAEDLRRCQFAVANTSSNEVPANASPADDTPRVGVTRRASDLPSPTQLEVEPSGPTGDLQIIPKGLRSFDARDADFFLELLPGPRSRDGLPESLRFWKTRIDTTQVDQGFTVGMLYGPSGCGKSSLVKAGLLPRLADHVTAIYLEATPHDTENNLLTAIRNFDPSISPQASLADAISAVRRGDSLGKGKLLLVVDQFEQWLHSHRSSGSELLVEALRQCDGVHVQCLLSVRDDFWMSSYRFMDALEIELVPDRNVAVVDLFDALHSAQVLTRFGQAYGRIPAEEAEISPAQQEFITAAVQSLSEDERVVCVRLALFADLVKGKPWQPETLKQYGGAQGLGVMFLEEAFDSRTAMPQHRACEPGARAVLKSLLPGYGTDIKGAVRSRSELMKIAGLESEPDRFAELLRVLDGGLRLITPADGGDSDSTKSQETTGPESDDAGYAYYQLTHDYLVPSLREWLTRHQRESMKGRAELRLAERAGVWGHKPSSRNLPSLWEWANIRLLTSRQSWSQLDRRMMSAAARFYGARLAVAAVVLILAAWCGYDIHGRLRANQAVEQLQVAEFNEVPRLVESLKPYQRWAEPILKAKRDETRLRGDRDAQLRCALALITADPGQADYLVETLRTAGAPERKVICDALQSHGGRLAGSSQELVELVLDADAELFQMLMPVVQTLAPDVESYREFVTQSEHSRQSHELSEVGASAELLDRVAHAQGMLAARFAFCQQIPFAEADEIIAELEGLGYRPVRFRPFALANEQFVSIAWTRDSRPWRIESDKTADEIKQLDAQHQEQGYSPSELVGWLDTEQSERYTAIWIQSDDDAPQRVITVGVPDVEHAAQVGDWIRRRQRAITYHKLMLADGTVRESTVREYTDRAANGVSVTGSEFAGLQPAYLQTDIQICALPWSRVLRTGEEHARLEQRLAADPANTAAALRLAARQAAAGDYQAAIEVLTTVLAGDDESQHASACGQRAFARACLDDRAGALEDLDQLAQFTRGPLRLGAHALRVYAALGTPEAAEGKLEGVLQRYRNRMSPVQWADAAAAYGLAATVVRRHSSETSERYATRAIELFDRAIELGLGRYHYRIRSQIREDPAFDSIRGLPAFQDLLTEHRFDFDYSGSWFNRTNVESRTLSDLSPAEHLEACRELANEGFQIAAISVADVGGETPNLLAASVWHRPVASRAEIARSSGRRANAVMAAYQLGTPDLLWASLPHTLRPNVRTTLVNRLRDFGIRPAGLAQRFEAEADVSAKRALLLAIGEYEQAEFGEAFVQRLLQLHQSEGDAGLHGAAEWVLRRWDCLPEAASQELALDENRDWFVNSQGQTFTVVRGPITFQMGSPSYEPERESNESLHERRIPRSFAIATTEVTVEQYRRFLRANPAVSAIGAAGYSPDQRCPVLEASWYRAAQYCNWLSIEEGLEPIYVPDADGVFGSGMSIHEDALERTGYRLPTHAEREFVARAGAESAWSFGDSPEMLRYYGWYNGNSGERSAPVGSLKPNELGLFDIHGNALEWVQHSKSVLVGDCWEDRFAPFETRATCLGGSWRTFPRNTRSAYAREGISPSTKFVDGGFRICRTLPD